MWVLVPPCNLSLIVFHRSKKSPSLLPLWVGKDVKKLQPVSFVSEEVGIGEEYLGGSGKNFRFLDFSKVPLRILRAELLNRIFTNQM